MTGFAEIMEIYRGIAADTADSKHFWNVTLLDDGTLECHWVNVTRAVQNHAR